VEGWEWFWEGRGRETALGGGRERVCGLLHMMDWKEFVELERLNLKGLGVFKGLS